MGEKRKKFKEPTLNELNFKERPKYTSIAIVIAMVAFLLVYWLNQDTLPTYMFFVGFVFNIACIFMLTDISHHNLAAFRVKQIKNMTVAEFKDEYDEILQTANSKALESVYAHYRKVIFYIFLKNYGEQKAVFINKIANDNKINSYIEIEQYIVDNFMKNESLDDVLLKELLV